MQQLTCLWLHVAHRSETFEGKPFARMNSASSDILVLYACFVARADIKTIEMAPATMPKMTPTTSSTIFIPSKFSWLLQGDGTTRTRTSKDSKCFFTIGIRKVRFKNQEKARQILRCGRYLA
eukprot:SAG31_NODE_602_length_13638_cov_32.936037_5_plen_122_part_00